MATGRRMQMGRSSFCRAEVHFSEKKSIFTFSETEVDQLHQMSLHLERLAHSDAFIVQTTRHLCLFDVHGLYPVFENLFSTSLSFT